MSFTLFFYRDEVYAKDGTFSAFGKVMNCFFPIPSLKRLVRATKFVVNPAQLESTIRSVGLQDRKHRILFNALTAVGALMTLIDFTLSNARRFYSSMGNLLDGTGLTTSKTMSLLTPSRSNECSGHL